MVQVYIHYNRQVVGFSYNIITAISDDDFESVSTTSIFGSGTRAVNIQCIPAHVIIDNMLECEEHLRIHFGVITTGTSISTGNNVTDATIIDGEGMYLMSVIIYLIVGA